MFFILMKSLMRRAPIKIFTWRLLTHSFSIFSMGTIEIICSSCLLFYIFHKSYFFVNITYAFLLFWIKYEIVFWPNEFKLDSSGKFHVSPYRIHKTFRNINPLKKKLRYCHNKNQFNQLLLSVMMKIMDTGLPLLL